MAAPKTYEKETHVKRKKKKRGILARLGSSDFFRPGERGKGEKIPTQAKNIKRGRGKAKNPEGKVPITNGRPNKKWFTTMEEKKGGGAPDPREEAGRGEILERVAHGGTKKTPKLKENLK